MTVVIIVAIGLALFGALVLALWGASWVIDAWIKEYIDYAKKGKGDGSR